MEDLSAIFNTNDKTTPGFYPASQTALLLLDFHTLFVTMHGGISAPNAVKAAARLRAWAKTQGIHIIHGLIDIDGTPYATCKGVERLQLIAETMKKGGAEEAAELLTEYGAEEKTFKRIPGHVSALKSPGLVEYLEQNNIHSLVLTGLSTSGCVLRTAIPATDAEFVVTTISDACADPIQEVHDLVTTKVLSARGYVLTAAAFEEGFEQAAKSRAA